MHAITQEHMVPLLVDANSLWARSYYAAAHIAPDRQHHVGVELMIQTVMTLINPLARKLPLTPTHSAFLWDGTAKRDKGRAPKTPEYLQSQLTVARILTEVFNAANGYPEEEADDAVATLAEKFHDQAKAIFVVSGDKDLQQLANNKVVYYSLNDKSVLPHAAICAKWHVKHPSQVAVALAILGDAGDLIDGIKGWGPKKVSKLFEPIHANTPILEVAEHVMAAMSDAQKTTFAEALDLTYLRRDIPNLPDPTPIVVNDPTPEIEQNWPKLAAAISNLKTTHDLDANITPDQLD